MTTKTTVKKDYYEQPIFVLTHNYSVNGKSLGVNEQNHTLYELTVKNSDQKYVLHYFKKDGKKYITVEHNENMTVNDCEKIMNLGNTFKKHGYEFESDVVVEKKQTKLVQAIKLAFLNEIGESARKEKVVKTEREKIEEKIEKLKLKLKSYAD